MRTTAATLLDTEHARHLSAAFPGRAKARLVTLGEDRGVRISQKDNGTITGFWEIVTVTSAATWVWWMPGQDIRTAESEGTLLALVGAPIHYPEEWAARVVDTIDAVKDKRGSGWSMPI